MEDLGINSIRHHQDRTPHARFNESPLIESGRNPDLVPEITGIAGPRDRHGQAAQRCLGQTEVRKLLDFRGEFGEDRPRGRPLDREDAVPLGDVLDLDVATVQQAGEIRKVRLGRRQQVVVRGMPEHDAVLDNEAPIVTPDRVLAVTRRTCRDVAGEHAAQEWLRVRAVDPVLEQRRRVEQPGAVADGEVLELLGDLVLGGSQVADPVGPQAGFVRGARALVEGRGSDHRRPVSGLPPRPARRRTRRPDDGRRATITAIGRLRNIV